MSYWAPETLRKSDPNGLFKMEEEFTVVKKSLTPIQAQRMLDGTPHTKGARSALRPEGPTLHLEGLSKSVNADKKAPALDADEVLKAYLAHAD